MTRFDDISAIESNFKAGKLERAEHLARAYADELHLLAGFRGEQGQAAELIADPDVLRRVLPRMREIAEGETESLAPELAELHKFTERNRLVAETCTSVLQEIGGEVAAPESAGSVT